MHVVQWCENEIHRPYGKHGGGNPRAGWRQRAKAFGIGRWCGGKAGRNGNGGCPMDADELLRRYARGERAFENADLRGAGLAKQVLQGANLRGANLCGTNLSEADLQAADLSAVNSDLAQNTACLTNLNRADL